MTLSKIRSSFNRSKSKIGACLAEFLVLFLLTIFLALQFGPQIRDYFERMSGDDSPQNLFADMEFRAIRKDFGGTIGPGY